MRLSETRNEHRNPLLVATVVLAEEQFQVTLLEVNTDQDVDGHSHRKEQLSQRHQRRAPEPQQQAEIERMTDELVEISHPKRRVPVGLSEQSKPDLAQSEQVEVIDDEGR